MKKQLLTKVFAPALLIALGLNAFAQPYETNENASSENLQSGLPGFSITFDNAATNGASAWVTIYNNFGSIRDVGFVNAGQSRLWTGYYPPLSYSVRSEVIQGTNCAGPKVDDLSVHLGATADGQGARLFNYQGPDGHTKYTLGKFSATKPEVEDLESAKAQVSLPGTSISVEDAVQDGASVWVTIYNTFGSIRDSGCVNPGQLRTWTGYYPPFTFNVRTEIIKGLNCSGPKVDDQTINVANFVLGEGVRVLSYGNPTKYFLQKFR